MVSDSGKYNDFYFSPCNHETCLIAQSSANVYISRYEELQQKRAKAALEWYNKIQDKLTESFK